LQQDVTELLEQNGYDYRIPNLYSSCCEWCKAFVKKRADGRQQEAIDFFMLFANAKCDKIAIENPVGIMSSTCAS
jgi:hypothetical protein